MNRLIVLPLPASCIPALEQDDDALPGVLDPVLQLQQLNLQQALVVVVLRPIQPLGIGVVLAPGVDDAAVGMAQDRVILIGVVHPDARRHDALSNHGSTVIW